MPARLASHRLQLPTISSLGRFDQRLQSWAKLRVAGNMLEPYCFCLTDAVFLGGYAVSTASMSFMLLSDLSRLNASRWLL